MKKKKSLLIMLLHVCTNLINNAKEQHHRSWSHDLGYELMSPLSNISRPSYARETVCNVFLKVFMM